MRAYLTFLFCCFIPWCYSQTPVVLADEIALLNNDPVMKHATWSISVVPAERDTVVFEYNSQISLIPASTLKTITTGAALNMLGRDFTFLTKLEHDGVLDVTTGVLKGNLYITGGGDPTLDSKYFRDEKDSTSITDKWALVLKNKGIKKIEGAVIADAEVFDENIVPPQWIWADIGNYFGAGASGLSCHDNSYTLFFNSMEAGSNAVITKTESLPLGLKITNNVRAGGKIDSAYIYGAPYNFNIIVEGSIPAHRTNYGVEGSLPDPALFCAQSLEQSLIKLGVPVQKGATTVKELKQEGNYKIPVKSIIHTHHSPSLDKIVYWTNIKSINLYAEHLLKYLAFVKYGVGREEEGIRVVMGYWKGRGVDVGGMLMNDGCGLSRGNLITTKTQAQILRKMTFDKDFDVFFNSLPIAGKTGSLSNMCVRTLADNNLRAKSGYITGVRAYAGYVKNRKGKLLCFSLLANNYECTPLEMKKKLERILVALAELEY